MPLFKGNKDIPLLSTGFYDLPILPPSIQRKTKNVWTRTSLCCVQFKQSKGKESEDDYSYLEHPIEDCEVVDDTIEYFNTQIFNRSYKGGTMCEGKEKEKIQGTNKNKPILIDTKEKVGILVPQLNIPCHSEMMKKECENKMKPESLGLKFIPSPKSVLDKITLKERPHLVPNMKFSNDSSNADNLDLTFLNSQSLIREENLFKQMKEDAEMSISKQNYIRGIDICRRILQNRTKSHGKTHFLVAESHHRLGLSLMKYAAFSTDPEQKKNNINSALLAFRNVETILLELDSDHPILAESMIQSGRLKLMKKCYGESLNIFRKVLQIRINKFGDKDSPLVGEVYVDLGLTNKYMGNFQKGKHQLARAARIQCKCLSYIDKKILKHPSKKRNTEQINAVRLAKVKLAEILFHIGALCLEFVNKDKTTEPCKEILHAYRSLSQSLTILKLELGQDHPNTIKTKYMCNEAKTQLRNFGQ